MLEIELPLGNGLAGNDVTGEMLLHSFGCSHLHCLKISRQYFDDDF